MKAMKNKICEFLERSEIEALYRACDKTTLRGLRDFVILALMLNTGLRRHEVSTLTQNSLQKQSGRVYLYVRTKGNKAKKIPIRNLKLLVLLGRYFSKTADVRNPDSQLFWSIPQGKEKKTHPITDETIRRVVERARRRARISKRITPHSLRHTFLTQALRAGADIKTVQALAGHSNISTTSRYLHTTDELMEAAIENLKF